VNFNVRKFIIVESGSLIVDQTVHMKILHWIPIYELSCTEAFVTSTLWAFDTYNLRCIRFAAIDPDLPGWAVNISRETRSFLGQLNFEQTKRFETLT
jgi:hypothetical protein